MEYFHVTRENLYLHEKDLMLSEELFPEEIRETPENYRKALQQEGAVCLIARVKTAYVGNVLGFSPAGEFRSALRINELTSDTDGLIYLYNIVTMPEFQSMGYGKKLLTLFIEKAALAGFKKIGGHFRKNGSLKNFREMGGEDVAIFEDWFSTGEEYVYCELPLKAETVTQIKYQEHLLWSARSADAA